MLIPRRNRCLPVALAATVVLACCSTNGRAAQAAPAAAPPAIQLQSFTASDQSASAGVPAGWQVVSAGQTVIQMAGPSNESVSLGNTVIARNAAFQLGEKTSNGIDISMPYTATLPQKFTMVLQQGAAAKGRPTPQVTIDSTTPLQLPAAIGQCGRIVADVTGPQGATKVLAVFCSLPVDTGGTYKNIMLLAQAFAATAAQDAPIAQAIFQSYRIPTDWLQKKLAPFTAPPAAPPASAAATAAETAAILRATAQQSDAINNSVNCFDLSVLRQTPTYQLPRSCGGTMPD